MINLEAYLRPTSWDGLWQCLSRGGDPTLLCAGGTDLVPRAQGEILPPVTWVDIRGIPELSQLDIREQDIYLGAALTHHQVSEHPHIRRALPALADACGAVGSRQIRALGTLGGNAANCSPCADSVVALVALGATVILRSQDEVREIPIEMLARGPGETALHRREVIQAFVVPRVTDRRSVFLKVGPRRAVAVAKVSVAASGVLRDGSLHQFRLALGSVAPKIVRVSQAENALQGRRPTEALIQVACTAAEAASQPIDDVRSTAEYRRHLVGVLTKRALEALAAPE